MQRPARLRPLAEILALTALLTSYIWGWGSTFRGDFSLCVVIYFAIGLTAHMRAGERPADLGLRLDNLGPASRDAALATLPIAIALLGVGALLGSIEFPPLARWPKILFEGSVWGTIQQYGLLCIYYRRFGELLPGPRSRMLAASAVFGLLHVPNPFLAVATFAAGMLSCWLYRREPNLIVLGIMHGIIAFLMVETLPDSITMGMRVGPGYFNFEPGR